MAEAALPARGRLILRVVLAGLAGAVLLGLAGFAAGAIIGAGFGASRQAADRMMILVFTLGPAAMVAGAVLGALLALRAGQGRGKR